MTKRKQKSVPGQQQSGLWLNSLISGGIGLAVTAVAAILAPFFAMWSSDPNSMAMPMAVICLLLGGAASGIIASKLCKGREISVSAISAGVMFLPILLISFLFNGSFDIWGFLIMTAALLISDLGGAVLFAKIQGSNKRNMKKIMKHRFNP